MTPTRIDPNVPAQVAQAQDLLSRILAAGGHRYAIHPGDLAWWIYHADPRTAHGLSYWLVRDRALIVLDASAAEVCMFALPDVPTRPLLDWAQHELGGAAAVALVSTADLALEALLSAAGYAPAGHTMSCFQREVALPLEGSPLAPGWCVRAVQGEHEADARRAASHSAFRSTMAPSVHLARYLGFMRSPAYVAERDLVAVDLDGRVGSFLVWWADERTRTAQLEPVGTHASFQRQGLARAVLLHALSQMREHGITTVRVCTDDHRTDAVGFYRATSFTRVAGLRSWKPAARSGAAGLAHS